MERRVKGAVVIVAATILIVTWTYGGLKFSTTFNINPTNVETFVESTVIGKIIQINSTTGSTNGIGRHLPQIIGIGSKKCGTAAFKTFLKLHSRVHVTAIDETHFFDENYEQGIEYYRNLMPITTASGITFEKTPKYIVSKNVPPRIMETYDKEKVPTPRFVLVVCDPVQRAYSDFIQSQIQNVSQPNDFDEYLNLAFKTINATAPPGDDFKSFYTHMDALYQNRSLRNIVRGVYSYFLRHWLTYFPRKDFVVVDGIKLLTDPGQVMVQAQRDLGLKVEIQPQNFVFVPEKGFFCVQLEPGENRCLGSVKGRTRKVDNGTVLQPKLSHSAQRILADFYRPFNEDFNRLTQTDIL